MLGLGNAINKARRRTVFVSTAPEGIGFNALALGSLGEAGYILSFYQSDENGNASEVGSYVTYTEVYPSHYVYFDPQENESNKATAVAAAADVLDHIAVGITEEGESVDCSGWRFADSQEFENFVNFVYSDDELNDDYQEGNSENPYLTVRSSTWYTWSQYDPIGGIQENQLNSWLLEFTNNESQSPTLDQVNNETFYFLPVRKFTRPIQWNTPPPPPALSPLPLDPGPEAFQSRSSGDLNSGVFDLDFDESINFSINGELLEGSDFSMYLANPTNRITGTDVNDLRFQLQFILKFPVDPNDSNSAFNLPHPWHPSNTEQKRMRISMLNLGYKDIPFYSPNPTIDDVFNDFGTTGILDFLDTDYAERRYPNIEVLLNKVTQDDMTDSNQVVFSDGFINDTSTGLYSFAYTGYLNVKDFKAKNLSNAFDDNQKIEDLTDVSVIASIADEKRFFMLRVESIEYGTTTRPYGDLIALPNEMRYIMFPILPKANTKTFFENTDYSDFVDSLWSSTGQNLPPEIPGQTEDYYD